MFSLLLRTVTVLLTILFAVTSAHAYTAYDGCPNLSNLGASYVEAYTGRTWEPMQDKGVVEGRHTVISTQGTDPYTDNKLKLLPEGATSVVRLGNDLAEAETDVLVYHFRVDADNPILKLRYAVVMENPGHAKSEQPRFNLQVLDVSGRLINDNSSYDVYASANAAGFHTSAQKGKLGSSIIWCDWSSMGVDLSSKVGQEVQIRISTYDCGAFEHFAYAYFTAECIEKKISIENCKSTSYQLVAPEGFKSYKWSTGETTRTITVSNNQAKQTISCTITSASGGTFTLYAVLSNSSLSTGKTVTEKVIAGDEYSYEGVNLPTRESGTYRFDYYNTKSCSFVGSNNVGVVVEKKPEKRTYLEIKQGICEGDSYEGYGFSYIKPAVGSYRDTLPCTTCKESYPQYYVLNLTVSPAPSFPTIKGPQDLCQGESGTFQASGGRYVTNYQWELNRDGKTYVRYSSSIEEEFLDAGIETIKFVSGNGCQTKVQSVKVNVHPNYKKIYFDTVCVGTKYSEHGFNLGVLKEEGNIVRSKTLQSEYGCDSLVVLSLFVAPEVKVRIEMKGDSVLCEDKEIKLTAKGGLDYEKVETVVDRILIGDIHCTDGTILHPADYAKSGKTADGVVAYLDETGEHGAIINLTDKTSTLVLPYVSEDELYKLTRVRDELYVGEKVSKSEDNRLLLDGYENTRILENELWLEHNVFLKGFDYSSEWYIPSYGEMITLYSSIDVLNNSIKQVGGVGVDAESIYVTSSSYYGHSTSSRLVCLAKSVYGEYGVSLFTSPYTLYLRTFKKF